MLSILVVAFLAFLKEQNWQIVSSFSSLKGVTLILNKRSYKPSSFKDLELSQPVNDVHTF